MSDQIIINVVTDPPTNITISDTGENVYLNPLTLNQGIINHSVTHQSGGSDVLFHNLLGGLSGGSSGAYFHLSAAQYENLTTGSVIRPSDTGAFYPASNPSGFITGVNLSSYATISFTTGISGSLQSQITTINNATGIFVTESETGLFYPSNNPSGFITGVDLSAYVTGAVVRPSETGAFVTQSQTGQFYPASNPSGFITGVNLSSYATTSYVTGVSGALQSQITTLNSQTGSYVTGSVVRPSETGALTGAFYPRFSNPSQFITNASLIGYATTSYVTGVSGFLQTQITTLNSRTGSYVTGSVVRPSETGIFITQSQTGQFYPSSNPSGFITGVDLSFSGNYYTKSESESRYVNTTGTETILGDKTFHDRVYINNLYVTGLETIVNTTNTNVASNYIMLNLTGGAVDGGLFFVTGSGLTGINDSGAIIGFDHSDKFKFGIGTRASDLSVLNTVAAYEQVTGISGSLQTQISTLDSATGNYALKAETGVFITQSQTGQFYAASNPNNYATVVDPVRTTVTGNGATSVYAISGASGLVNPSALIVAIDGVLQEPSVDYTVATGTVTFTSPLPSGSKAVIVSPTNTLQVSNMIPADGSVTSAKIAGGVSLSDATMLGTTTLQSVAYSTTQNATDHINTLGLISEPLFQKSFIHARDYIYNVSNQTNNRYGWTWRAVYTANLTPNANFTKGTRGEILSAGQSYNFTNTSTTGDFISDMTWVAIFRPIGTSPSFSIMRQRSYNAFYTATNGGTIVVQYYPPSGGRALASKIVPTTDYVCIAWSGNDQLTRAGIWHNNTWTSGSHTEGSVTNNGGSENFSIGAGQGGAGNGLEFVAFASYAGLLTEQELGILARRFYETHL
jgi:hypothetical protein